MLPAVSSEDCLFADLGIDPADRGWQSFDATDFLVRGYEPDPAAALVLWQVDALGKADSSPAQEPDSLRILGERLGELYPPEHELVFYLASTYPIADAHVERVRLDRLAALKEAPAPTLYIAPARRRPNDRSGRGSSDSGCRSLDRERRPRPVGRDLVPLRLEERQRPLELCASLVLAPLQAQDLAQVKQHVTVQVEQVGLLDDRQGLARDAFGCSERTTVGQEPGAREPDEHLRPDVVLRRGLLDEPCVGVGLLESPRALSVRESIAATEARWPSSPSRPSSS